MAQAATDAVRRLLQDAVELSTEVPEQSREDVLPLLVDHLLAIERARVGADDHSSRDRIPRGEVDHPPASQETDVSEWEAGILSGLPEGHVVAEGSRRHQAAWAVIRLRQQGKDANPDSVRSIIKDELGLSPQSRSNTSKTLGNLVPRHLTREKEGRAYVYRPTRHALAVFEEDA